jgi:hypothetical protein
MTKTPAQARIRRVAAVAALLVLPACDTVDRARSQLGTTDTISVASTGSGVMLGLQAPGMLRAGEEGVLRLSLTNRTDTTAMHIRLELIVPAWAEPMPPRPGDRDVSMVALAEGGTKSGVTRPCRRRSRRSLPSRSAKPEGAGDCSSQMRN